jgi:hypothetical protein
VGLTVEAHAAAVLSGFTSAAQFDAVQRALFVDALVGAVPLVKRPSDVAITAATLVPGRRQLLAAPTLRVEYTLTVTSAGATSGAAVGAALSAQLVAAFTTPGGGGSASPFAQALTQAAAAKGLPPSAVLVTVDEAATTALVAALTVVVTKQHTIRPTAAPTAQPQPAAAAKKSARFTGGDPTFYIGAAAAVAAILLVYFAWRAWLRRPVKVAPAPGEAAKGVAVEATPAAASREPLPPLRFPGQPLARIAPLDATK